MDPILKWVKSVPAGSIIRFVAYSFSWQRLADALIEAHDRGVQVRLLIDSHHYQLVSPGTDTPQLKALRSAPTNGRLCAFTPLGNSLS